MLPAGLALAFPWALLALPLLLLLPGGRGAWWRRGALALLILALAQPSVRAPGERVALLVDVSDSVGDDALRAARGLDLSGLGQAPQVFYVAGDSARVSGLDAQVPDVVRPGATDLARALQVAAAAGARRALLVSDGAQSRGSALDALPEIPVDTLAAAPRPNLRLTDLLLPSQAAPGEQVEGVAVLTTDRPGRVTLHPTVGDSELPDITRDVPAGRSAIPFTFRAGNASNVEVTASATADFDQPTADDRQSAELTVRARPPVLVLGDPALAALLRTQGIDVVNGTTADIRSPLEAGAVVLRGSAADYTPGQLEVLKQYVETGGGLMMTGGPASFGLGGWYRTAVEDVLPVTTDLRTEVSLPLVAMVIVLDRSQSMSSGQPSKIELAKEGAVQVVDLAYKDDLLGLIAFSDPSSTSWVFQLRPATERGKREMLQGILALDTGGGTVLGPAYRMALDALQQTDAAVKHIIVLSDGKLYDGQGPFAGTTPTDFRTVAANGLRSGITTSTIAIGESADFEQLHAIADAGGGRYYEALDVSTLPQIFTNEALTATRSLLVDDPTDPKPHPNPLVALPATVPQVNAYVATTLKPDAQMLLEGRRSEPILAIGRAGLGRTAALTTDLNAWSGPLGELARTAGRPRHPDALAAGAAARVPGRRPPRRGRPAGHGRRRSERAVRQQQAAHVALRRRVGGDGTGCARPVPGAPPVRRGRQRQRGRVRRQRGGSARTGGRPGPGVRGRRGSGAAGRHRAPQRRDAGSTGRALRADRGRCRSPAVAAPGRGGRAAVPDRAGPAAPTRGDPASGGRRPDAGRRERLRPQRPVPVTRRA